MTAVEEEDPEVASCPQRKFSLAEQREIKKKYEKLIHKIANRQGRLLQAAGVATVDVDDLFVIGLRATFKAIETYDASRGAKESSWVALRARQAIQREVHRALGLKTKDVATLREKNPTPEAAARLAAIRDIQFLPLGSDTGQHNEYANGWRRTQEAPPLVHEHEPGWIDLYEEELRWLHTQIRRRLTPMERRVLDAVFSGDGPEARLAEHYSVTKQRINQIKLKAIDKLRKAANRTLFRE